VPAQVDGQMAVWVFQVIRIPAAAVEEVK